MIDVVNQKALIHDPSDDFGSKIDVEELEGDLKETAETAYQELLEAVGDRDEEVMGMLLEDKTPDATQLKQAIRRLTVAGEIVPVLGGSAFKNKGVQPMVDAVIDYLPSPLDVDVQSGADPDDETKITEFPADDNAPFCSLAFKLWTDPFAGKLFSSAFIVDRSVRAIRCTTHGPVKERVNRIMMIQADKQENVETVYAGDIAALVGIRNITTGDTLCTPDIDVCLEPPTFPEPVISMAIEPDSKADQEKMAVGLQALAEEDPTFKCYTDEETGQTLVAGMGELHLEIIRDRLKREFKVQAIRRSPDRLSRDHHRRRRSWPFQEAIRWSRSVRRRHDHHRAHRRGSGVEVESKIVVA